MPQTFIEFLQHYPEVLQWYNELPLQQALDFETRTKAQLESGQAVAVSIHNNRNISPVLTYTNNLSFVLYPPIDGFIGVPLTCQVHFPNRNYSVFVPYHSFKQCAECLETPDLRTAQIRAIRIIRYLNDSNACCNFVAENWRGYRQALIRYGIYMAEEYVSRGFSSSALDYLKPLVRRREWNKPNWVYDENEWMRHRSHLCWRSFKRNIAVTIHKVHSSISGFLKQHNYNFRTLANCNEVILHSIRHTILRNYTVSEYANFYNWDVPTIKGNF